MAMFNGIECSVFDTSFRTGISTKEFSVYYTMDNGKVNIIGLDGILYGEYFSTDDINDINYYIANYMPNIVSTIKGE